MVFEFPSSESVFDLPYLSLLAVGLGTRRKLAEIRYFRIPEEVDTLKLYHGTTTRFGDGISQYGLLPHLVTGNVVHEQSYPWLVYLAREELAMGYALKTVRKFSGLPLIIESIVGVSQLTDDHTLQTCFPFMFGWRNSLELVGTCAYYGSILDVTDMTVFIARARIEH